MKKSSTKKSQYHHGNLKAEAVRVATDLLVKEGADGITIRKVAREIGVFPNALYRHFGNKDELIASLAERGFDIFEQIIKKNKVFDGNSPEERINDLGLSYLEFAYKEPHFFYLLFSNVILDPSQFPDLFSKGIKSFNLLTEIIQEIKKRKIITKKKSTEETALIIWASIHGFVSLATENRFRFLGITKLNQYKKMLKEQIRITLAGLKK